MSKILLYSDNHFCTYSSIVRTRGQKYSTRLENQLKTMKWIDELALQENCSATICLGDFFDKPSLTAEEIAALSEIKFSVDPYFIIGNHEMGNAELSFSSAHAFLQNTNAQVFAEPSIISFENTLIYILPYQLETDRKEKVLEYFTNINIPEGRQKILLTHNDIKNIQMGPFLSTSGFDKNDLSSNFDLVINGHIHNQYEVAPNVINIGNITGQNFNEDAFVYEHHAIILDTESLCYKYVKNPHAFNFYKIDWSKDTDIDIINNISARLSNAILSIKTNSTQYEYIKYRFDPSYNPPPMQGFPKNRNVIQCRVIESKDLSINPISGKDNIESLHLDPVEEFRKFIINIFGNDAYINAELQEVLK